MAEALISPGVFLRENDLSQITAGPITVGAALVGPTVTGRKDIPTLVTSYSQYKAKFGTTFVSGGNTHEYMTSQAAYNYFQQGGTSLLVTRVASGSYTSATASVANSIAAVAGASANASFDVSAFTAAQTGSGIAVAFIDSSNNYIYLAGAAFGFDYNAYYDTLDYGYFSPNSGNSYTLGQWTASLITFANSVSELGLTLSSSGTNIIISGSNAKNGTKVYSNLWIGSPSGSGVLKATLSGGTASTPGSAFELETISVGTVMNNTQGAATATNGVLPSGSANNVRWQIVQADTGSGVFTLLIRAGNDYTANQTVLETWTNISLDPNQNNYIAYVIGDQVETVKYDTTGQAYLQVTGSYPNASNYVRVKSVNYPTPNYLNPQGQPYAQYTSSIPVNGSGSLNGAFGGATGPLFGCDGLAPLNLFEQIPTIASVATSPTTNIQGVFAADYDTAINLLANQDSYVYNSIYVPGLTNQNGTSQISALLATVANRGDAIAVVDMVGYGQSSVAVTTAAQSYDNSYGATYWPWVQVRSNETGRLHFVPASVVIPGVYEYNDKVSAEWFAPAGLNRGGLPTVIQPEQRLTVAQRNTLYTAKVNPIAVFPGQGTVVYGQKTLQARASALDRVNVRRLLIALKSYIGQIAQTLVFEQNTAVTRNRFLSQVNPYLEYVQQRQGLYAFRVVMDDTNNTPDVIDRNLLVGAIYLQPTRTAEFIQLDFNILPTGVTFGQ